MAQSYSFASMRVRMYERDLIADGQWKRLLASQDLDQAVQILKETRYGDLFEGLDHAEDFDRVLREEVAKQAKMVEDLVEEDDLAAFLFLKYDIHNLKVLIKEAGREDDREEGEDTLSSLAYPFGHLFLPAVKEWIREPNRNPKQTDLQKATAEGLEVWTESQDAQALDLVLDRWYFRSLHHLSETLPGQFFRESIQKMADGTNILSFFRAKRQGLAKDFLARVLVEGGKIPYEDFFKLYGWDQANYGLFFQKANLGRDFEEALNQYLESGAIAGLERAKDQIQRQSALEASRYPEGPEVIYGYMNKVETEAQNLRILLNGKRLSLPEEEIKERMRTNA
ncbi:V-type ATPase subunit [Kallipyga massiliensis]|uniref:V-type ATPase subunit n=1 Tax=Kallipyga massiliensis TaxID=1472764 RepID=UPI00056C74CE|nr:V-type ATPase subunit [Kallipyga massiliensis]